MAEIGTVGVIGLGNMGAGMARSLVRAGYSVLGFDLDQAACARARAGGVGIAGGLDEVGRAADALVTVLPDSPQVEGCFLGRGGVLPALRVGTACIECSTIEPAVTDRVAGRLRDAGCVLVDAAMGRSPAEAEAGDLLFMVGGNREDLDRVRPVLEAMGSQIEYCGPPGSGIRTKLVLNLLSQSTCQLSAEVVALGLKMGLDRDSLLAVLGGGLGANGFITRYWPSKVLAGDTEPGFAIELSAKDLRHGVAMAAEANVPIPTAAAAAGAVNAAALSHGALDVSGLLEVACLNAGARLGSAAAKTG